jgi:hypothetical protein
VIREDRDAEEGEPIGAPVDHGHPQGTTVDAVENRRGDNHTRKLGTRLFNALNMALAPTYANKARAHVKHFRSVGGLGGSSVFYI